MNKRKLNQTKRKLRERIRWYSALFAASISGLATLTHFGFSFASASAPEPDALLVSIETQILDNTNQYRAAVAAKPLLEDPKLVASARFHSQYMAQMGNFSHQEGPPLNQISGPVPANYYFNDRILHAGACIATFCPQEAENIDLDYDYANHLSTDDDISAEARKIADAFYNSPGHRANMLNPDLTHMGVGITVTTDGNRLDVYTTEDFAAETSLSTDGLIIQTGTPTEGHEN